MLNFGPTFRALTSGSPITTALYEARRMARRHLDAGGVATPVDGRKGSPGFLVPADVDARALAAAIGARLCAGARMPPKRDNSRPDVLQTMPNGQLVVPRAIVERIGGGNADSGKRCLERLLAGCGKSHHFRALKVDSSPR